MSEPAKPNVYPSGWIDPARAALDATPAPPAPPLDVGKVAKVFEAMREEDDLPDSSATYDFVAEVFVERYARLAEPDR
jgi:hypothetical protein